MESDPELGPPSNSELEPVPCKNALWVVINNSTATMHLAKEAQDTTSDGRTFSEHGRLWRAACGRCIKSFIVSQGTPEGYVPCPDASCKRASRAITGCYSACVDLLA